MSGWMIGLGLVGVFAGAAVGVLKEMTADWNGGQGTGRPLRNMAKSIAIGAAFGVGLGWLMTDGKSEREVAIEDCLRNAPAGQTVTVTKGPNGMTCVYKP